MFQLSLEQFKKCFPNCKQPNEWYAAFQKILPNNGITTKNQIACFLGQCAHESQEFNTLRENLNYSTDGLLTVFKKYFTQEQSKQYARQPAKIANRVYANRMGNGDESSGDGFKYRGIGIVQITGKDNMARASNSIFKDDRLVKTPELLLDKENAILAACWFWNSNALNKYADTMDIVSLTKRINGGTIGLEDRKNIISRIQKIIG